MPKDRRVTNLLYQYSLVTCSWQHSDIYIWSFVALGTFPQALGPRFPECLW